MKIKHLLVITVTLLLITSAVFYFYPLIKQEERRNEFNGNPVSSGTHYLYCFRSIALYTHQLYLTHEQFTCTDYSNGTLKLEVNPNGTISATIFSKSCVIGHSGTSTYTKVLSINNDFVEYFLNTISFSSSFININGLVGKISNSQTFFHICPGSEERSNCWTLPTDLHIINIDQYGMNTSVTRFNDCLPNRLCYDHSDGYNILVRAALNGNFSLASTLWPNSDIFLAQGFFILLLGTNAALHPLDKIYYTYVYEDYIVIMWLLAIPILYSVISASKKRVKKSRGIK